ncbi:hypothetical protein LP417_20255 [Polaromonas sp. P1-6]|nr:hypothetical protein LP417_20255 [Polaromonas sp. P1-6]
MYFLTEIRVADFESGAAPAQGRFKLVSPCLDPKRRESAEVLQAVSALENNDQRQAIKGLTHFVKLAQLGKPFNQLVDKKTVHEAFPSFYCEVTKKKETVWRYRHGDIRILFYYAADKVVLLAHTLPKRSDDLSEKDKEQAKNAVIDFLTATQSKAGLQWI